MLYETLAPDCKLSRGSKLSTIKPTPQKRVRAATLGSRAFG